MHKFVNSIECKSVFGVDIEFGSERLYTYHIQRDTFFDKIRKKKKEKKLTKIFSSFNCSDVFLIQIYDLKIIFWHFVQFAERLVMLVDLCESDIILYNIQCREKRWLNHLYEDC